MATLTSDLGLFIRDMIEGREFSLFNLASDPVEEIGVDEVNAVDASDANNLRVFTDGGAVFVVRIIREG